MKKIFLLTAFFIFAACANDEPQFLPESTNDFSFTIIPNDVPPVENENPVPVAEIFPPEIEITPSEMPSPPTFSADPIEILISQMTVEEKIGQLFILRLPWQTLAVNEAVEHLFDEIQPGGVILFGDNVASAQQVTALTAQ
ncbi:MAG: hypothetical protein LBI27_03100, partial [Clostridiales bacterium]|nr:hypothetical protein [Clostridiales bacterium]